VLDTIVLVGTAIRLVVVQTERSMFIAFDAYDLHTFITILGFVYNVGGVGGSLINLVPIVILRKRKSKLALKNY
jgi:hypothetical protein